MSAPSPPPPPPYPDELREKVLCAFCLNPGPTNNVPAGDGTAYLCDDCNRDMASYRKYPKFKHVIDTTAKTVQMIDLPEDVVSPPVQQQQPPQQPPP